tara:strand:- start:3768 stop:4049 length:282 start_codon:yes stop_codon:yes gene_type:complete
MSRYEQISRIDIDDEKRTGSSLSTAQFKKVEEKNSDLLLIATAGDRCDLLAQQYYGDSSFWWFIASVNKLKTNNIEAGTQIRVPISLDEAKLK